MSAFTKNSKYLFKDVQRTKETMLKEAKEDTVTMPEISIKGY